MTFSPSQLDAQLPELHSFARLIIQHDITNEYEVVAINLDDGSQVAVSVTPAYQFFPDCIGLDDSLAERYSAGIPVAVGMTAANWQSWIDNFELAQDDSAYVWLTISPDGDSSDCISAVCLTDHREVIAPPEQTGHFFPDCLGLDGDRFNQGYGTVCRMHVHNWQSWLDYCEVAELDDDIAAILSA